MSEGVYIAIGVIVVLLIIVAIVASTQRRTTRLHRTFGPEYDRTVQTAGDRRLAERELAGRVDRRERLTIIPLADAARQEYLVEWQNVQASFVDAPVQSVQQADALVARVMNDRGYPVSEFDQRAADASVDHPDVVENYRVAHAICLSSAQGRATTEELRQAMTQYRALFDKLLATGDAGTAPPSSPAQPQPVGASAAPRVDPVDAGTLTPAAPPPPQA
jgi:hypothetical protein